MLHEITQSRTDKRVTYEIMSAVVQIDTVLLLLEFMHRWLALKIPRDISANFCCAELTKEFISDAFVHTGTSHSWKSIEWHSNWLDLGIRANHIRLLFIHSLRWERSLIRVCINLYSYKSSRNTCAAFLEKFRTGKLYLPMNGIHTKIKSNRANAIITPELQRVYIDAWE